MDEDASLMSEESSTKKDVGQQVASGAASGCGLITFLFLASPVLFIYFAFFIGTIQNEGFASHELILGELGLFFIALGFLIYWYKTKLLKGLIIGIIFAILAIIPIVAATIFRY